MELELGTSARMLPVVAGALALGLVFSLCGCGSAGTPPGSATGAETGPTATSTLLPTPTSIPADPDVVIARAIHQLEAVLGLPDGAVTRSAEPPFLPGSEIALAWPGGGRTDLDLDTGCIVSIIPETLAGSSGELLSTTELDAAACRIAELLGWDDATLAAQGFTPEETEIMPHGDAPPEYSKRWVGHDDQGFPNGGLVDVGLDATSGRLLRFMFHPGPRASLDASEAINEREAIQIAKDSIGDAAQIPTTSAPPSEGATTTTLPPGVVVRSAELVHYDAPGITGGRDMLVWIVKLGGGTATGEVRATVYVDAISGEVLTWLVF